jgi:type III pantothenate kinase
MSGMILAFDIGNTFAKWGFVQDGAVVGGGRAVHRGRGLAAALDGLRLDRVPRRIVAVNVAGAAADAALAVWAERHHRLTVVTVTAATPARRVRTAYREPARLGADRWAAAVGAFHAYGACLVADLGTACTLDRIDRDGLHRGGYIVPGVDLMRDALGADTDAVKVDDVAVEPGAWGTDTAGCVAGGLRRALASLIDGAAAELAPTGAKLVLTGGDADRVAPWVGTAHRIDHDLVLRGAALLAEGSA